MSTLDKSYVKEFESRVTTNMDAEAVQQQGSLAASTAFNGGRQGSQQIRRQPTERYLMQGAAGYATLA